MNREIRRYFDDRAKWKGLPTINDTPTIKCDDINVVKNFINRSGLSIVRLGDSNYYLKESGYGRSRCCRIVDMVSSDMYNALGIDTPRLHLISNNSLKRPSSLHNSILYTATKDAINIPGFECVYAEDSVLRYLAMKYRKENYDYSFDSKWAMITQEDFKNDLLSIMTENCYNQLINIFLLDELRMDFDRHYNNYIFYKRPGSKKYEGIIPFDLEQVTPFVLMNNEGLEFDKNFGFHYLINKLEYDSQTAIEYLEDNKTYADRIIDIIELIQHGYLSDKSIKILKKEIEYDFPKGVVDVCQNPYLKECKDLVYDVYSRIWEYNRDTIGRELRI